MDKLYSLTLSLALGVSVALLPVLTSPAQAASKKGFKKSSYTQAFKSKAKKARYKRRSRGGGGCQTLSSDSLHAKASPYSGTIGSASSRYGVSPNLISAVITVESCFNSRARGTSGEKGLMQLMPGTARRFDIMNGYNVWQNVHGGTRYLSILLDRYNGGTHRAVAAYNAGEGNVGFSGPIRNQGYVSKVMTAYHKFSFKGGFQNDVHLARYKKAKKSKALVEANLAPKETQPAADTAKETVFALNNRSQRTARISRLTRSGRSNASRAQLASALPWPNMEKGASRSRAQTRAFMRPSGSRYAVGAGDTLHSIALAHQVSVAQLKRLNGIADPRDLSAGLSLRIR